MYRYTGIIRCQPALTMNVYSSNDSYLGQSFQHQAVIHFYNILKALLFHFVFVTERMCSWRTTVYCGFHRIDL